jgi:predicted RNase H-like HicB family nuclease
MKYVAIIQPTNRGFAKSFSAYSPDIPGCLANGPTEENAIEALKKAILYRIEKLEEVGLEVPKSCCKTEIIEIATKDGKWE